ncbi:MAG TPA: autotransporter domain-containing protein [Xanthobacteraceae bacterium]
MGGERPVACRKTGIFLASTSVAALLIGAGAPPALAAPACTHLVGAAFDNPSGHTTANVCVRNTSFTGNITNEGTISPSGIALQNGTVTGSIRSTGNILGGISLDHPSVLGGAASAIAIMGSTFLGGIVNSGVIAGTGVGILMTGTSTVGGGISNSGTISGGTGILVSHVLVNDGAVFSEGITNSGTIVGINFGIFSVMPTFTGGITNSGTITALARSGIFFGGGSGFTFDGGFSNTGKIVAKLDAVFVNGNGMSLFSGGMSNAGTLSADLGISLLTVSTFTGGIANSGTITASTSVGIAVTQVANFVGGISNGGTISAAAAGIELNGGNSTFAGGIFNSGTITSTGDTAISITNTSSFAGGISNSGTLAGVSGILVSHNVNDGTTFKDGIANSGTIAADNYGIFLATPTFLGGVSNSGTISSLARTGIFVGGFAGYTFAGGIFNSGTIVAHRDAIFINGNELSVFSGGISNAGTISGALGIHLLSFSTFTGGIVNSGTITASTSIGIAVTDVTHFSGGVTNTGTITGVAGIEIASGTNAVDIFDSGTITGTGGTAIDLTTGSAGNVLTLAPTFKITGNVLGQGGDTFQLGGSGSGAFDLSAIGPARQYQGFVAFNVISGIWSVTNTFGQSQAWNLNGGMLAGTGTLPGLNVNAGGTLAPGTLGVAGTTMTITGNLAFQPGAFYVATLGATASRANVGGTAALAGTVQAFFTPGTYTRTAQTILHSGGLGGTTFGGLTSNMPGFVGTLSYTTTDVLLGLTAGLGAGGGLNTNQQNVATTINNFFNGGGALPASFLPIFGLTGGNLGNALTLLSGEAGTGGQQAAFQSMSEFLSLMLDPSVGGRGFAPQQEASLPVGAALAYASAAEMPLKALPPASDRRWSAWGSAYGGSNHTAGDIVVGSHDVAAGAFGVAGGMDFRVTPDTVLGFGLAGGGTNWSLAQGLGGGRSDVFQAGLYGTTHAGPAYLAGALAFANHWMSTDRVAFAADHLTARFDAQVFGGRLETGYRFGAPSIGVTPYAAVQAQNFRTPAYAETDVTGGGLGLGVAARNATDTRSEVGARFDDLGAFDDMRLLMRARLAFAHDWVSDPSLLATFQALPGASFVVNGATPARNSALTSAGAELHVTPALSVGAKFDGEFARGSQTYAGTGTVRYAW